MNRITAGISLGLIFVGSCSPRNQKGLPMASLSQEIIALERSALDRWITFDPQGYLDPLAFLRKPTVARVHGSIKFPAKFMLVAAMNPTASGFKDDNPRARDKYLSKLSGPLLARCDSVLPHPAANTTNADAHATLCNEMQRPQRNDPPFRLRLLGV